jgi:hypothetical protein
LGVTFRLRSISDFYTAFLGGAKLKLAALKYLKAADYPAFCGFTYRLIPKSNLKYGIIFANNIPKIY